MNKLVDLNGMQMMAETISQKIQSSSGSGGGIISSDSVATLQSTYDPGNHKYVMSINQASGLFPIVFTASHAYHYGDKIELNGVMYDVVPYGGNLRDGIWGAGSLVSGYVDIDTKKFHVSIPETDGTYTIGDAVAFVNAKTIFEPLGDLSKMSEFDTIHVEYCFGQFYHVYRLGTTHKFYIVSQKGRFILDIDDMSVRDMTNGGKLGSLTMSYPTNIFQLYDDNRMVTSISQSGKTLPVIFNCETNTIVTAISSYPTNVNSLNPVSGAVDGQCICSGSFDGNATISGCGVFNETLGFRGYIPVSNKNFPAIWYMCDNSIIQVQYSTNSSSYSGIYAYSPINFEITRAYNTSYYRLGEHVSCNKWFLFHEDSESTYQRYFSSDVNTLIPSVAYRVTTAIINDGKSLTPYYAAGINAESYTYQNLGVTATTETNRVLNTGFARTSWFVYFDNEFIGVVLQHQGTNQSGDLQFYCRKKRFEIIG